MTIAPSSLFAKGGNEIPSSKIFSYNNILTFTVIKEH